MPSFLVSIYRVLSCLFDMHTTPAPTSHQVAVPSDLLAVTSGVPYGQGDILRFEPVSGTIPPGLRLECESLSGVFQGAFFLPQAGSMSTGVDAFDLDLPAATSPFDTEAVVTCAPDANTGSATSDIWVIDRFQFSLGVRAPRLVARTGTRAVRDSDGTRLPQGQEGAIGGDVGDPTTTVQISAGLDTLSGEIFEIAAVAGQEPDGGPVQVECGGDFFPLKVAGEVAEGPEGSATAVPVDLDPSTNSAYNFPEARVLTTIICRPSASANGWYESDALAVAVSLRDPRFKIVAGTTAYESSGGSKLAQGTHLSQLRNDLAPALASGKVYGATGIVSVAVFATTNGDLYDSATANPVSLECSSSDTAVLADPDPVQIPAFGGATPIGMAVEGTRGAAAVAEDAFVIVTCYPAEGTGVGNTSDLWTVADGAQVLLQIRRPRLIPVAGPESLRASDLLPMTASVTEIDRFATDLDALLVTEAKVLEPGAVLRLKLASPTTNGFELAVRCTSSNPAVIGAVPSFPMPAGSTELVDVALPDTSAVAADTLVTIECGADPATYGTGGLPVSAQLYMIDVALMEVTVRNNLPPESGLELPDNVLTLPTLTEDLDPLQFDIRTVRGIDEAGELDEDGTVVTFSTVCSPAKGTLVWDDPNEGIFTYTLFPNANGTDAVVFEVTDSLGAKSPFGIININITPVPDNSTANDVAITTLDGDLGRKVYSWAGTGLVTDPDGVTGDTHTVTIVQLPRIPEDLQIAAGDIISYQTDQGALCASATPAGGGTCYPRQVRATSFTYSTELNSITAFEGIDTIQFTVTDAEGTTPVGTLTINVNRQGDNNLPPTATDLAIEIVEEAPAAQVPFIVPIGADELLAANQLFYRVTTPPALGSLEVLCPEPRSWAEPKLPLVVTPPDSCERTYGSVTPACDPEDPTVCLTADGVLDPDSPANNPDSPDYDPAADPVYLLNEGNVGTPVGSENNRYQIPVFRYVPAPNFFGEDTFEYRSRDVFGDSDAATVTGALRSACTSLVPTILSAP